MLNANRISGLAEIDPSSLEFPLGGEERATGVNGFIHDCCERRSQQRGQIRTERISQSQRILLRARKGAKQELRSVKPKCEGDMHKIYPWQQPQWEYLWSRYKQQSVPHALLFSGQVGLGKLDFAKAFAELLLCKGIGELGSGGNDHAEMGVSTKAASSSPTNSKTTIATTSISSFACGHCVACKLMAANNHPDLLLIQPEKEGGIIKVDQIRTLIEDLSQTAQQGGYQVVIISPANAMNAASANALLKTLEEPLGQTIIILLSDKPTALPATIRSRCQLLSFASPSAADTRQWLQNNISQLTGVTTVATTAAAAADDITLAVNFSQGSPLRAQALLKEQLQLQNYQKLRQEILDVMQKKIHAINFAAAHADDDIQVIATIFLSLVMDMIKLYFNPAETFLSNQDSLGALLQIQQKIPLNKLFSFCDYLLKLNKMLHEHVNFNKQLLLEALCLRCCS